MKVSFITIIILLLSTFPAHSDTNYFNEHIEIDTGINPIKSFQLPNFELSEEINSLTDILTSVGLDPLYLNNYYGENIRVALIDSGINSDLDIFEGRVIDEISFVQKKLGYDSDEGAADLNGHGTMVGSVLLGNNSIYHGAAPKSEVVSIKVASSGGIITSNGLIAAVQYAISRGDIDIISLSLSEPEEGALNDPLENVVSEAVKNGIIVVASAGNSGSSSSSVQYFTMGSPGTSTQVITVGATDIYNRIAAFSSNGPTMGEEVKPDVVSPGTSIPVITSSGGGSNVQGTSFSAPIVSGAIAVLLSALKASNIGYSPGKIKSLIGCTAVDMGFDYLLQGNGKVNVSAALDKAKTSTYIAHALPLSLPINYESTLPAGTNFEAKVTLSSGKIGDWKITGIIGNISELVREIKFGDQGFESVVSTIALDIELNQMPGNYSGYVQYMSPEDVLVNVSVKIDVVSPATGRILIDLIHSPWDSVLTGSNRLERKFGWDLKKFISTAKNLGYWVDDIVSGDLTDEILSKYDILFMPSAFSKFNPPYFDHSVSRGTELLPSELIAINNFIQSRGTIILDFGGTSALDSKFDKVEINSNALYSIYSLLGLYSDTEFAYQDTGVSYSVANRDSNLLSALQPFSIKAGSNWIKGGYPIMGVDDKIASAMAYSAGSRSFVFNARNWRDNSALIFSGNGFLENVLSIINGDLFLLEALSIQEEQSTILRLKFNESIDASSFSISIDKSDLISDEIKYHSVEIVDNIAIVEFDKILEEYVNINIDYNGINAQFTKYIAGIDPVIIKDTVINNEDVLQKLKTRGSYTVSLIVIDDNLFPQMVNVELQGALSPYVSTENLLVGNLIEVKIKILSDALLYFKESEFINLLDNLIFNVEIAQYDNSPYSQQVLFDTIKSVSTSTTTEETVAPDQIVFAAGLMILVMIRLQSKNYKVLK